MKKLKQGLLYALYITCALLVLTLTITGVVYTPKLPPHYDIIPPYYGEPRNF